LRAGYSVLSFTSLDRQSGCWDATWPVDDEDESDGQGDAAQHVDSDDLLGALDVRQKRIVQRTTNADIESVFGALAIWLKREGREQVPLLAMGASGGGSFVTILARAIHLRAGVVIVSPGHPAAVHAPAAPEEQRRRSSHALTSAHSLFNLPPLLFIFMEEDKHWASSAAIHAAVGHIPSTHPALTATVPSRTGTFPLVHSLSVLPAPLDARTLLSIDGIRLRAPHCASLFVELASSLSSGRTSEAGILLSRHSFQLQDPREGALLQGVITKLQELATVSSIPSSDASHCARVFAHHRTSIEEILTERWFVHEMTSRRVDEQIRWTNAVMQQEAR
jgi:hypothetical protein